MSVKPYRPNPFYNEWHGHQGYPRDIKEVLGILAGAASVCWETPEGAGVFQSERASELVDAAYGYIRDILRNELNTVADTFDLGQIPWPDASAR